MVYATLNDPDEPDYRDDDALVDPTEDTDPVCIHCLIPFNIESIPGPRLDDANFKFRKDLYNTCVESSCCPECLPNFVVNAHTAISKLQQVRKLMLAAQLAMVNGDCQQGKELIAKMVDELYKVPEPILKYVL